MKGYDYQSDFAKKYVAEGRDEGRAEGRDEGRAEGRTRGRARVLTVLRVRGIAVPEAARERILAQRRIRSASSAGSSGPSSPRQSPKCSTIRADFEPPRRSRRGSPLA